jgi:LAO/AO transport system kinase
MGSNKSESKFNIMSLSKRILEGDIRAASKLMRDADDQIPTATETLKELYPQTGKAYVIGITGVPGSGKSTIVDKMAKIFRQEGKRVGILAVDPTSPFTGGAILGDRIRMQRHTTDEGVFIRSLATRGCLGGLSRSTQDIINVMDAMGKEVILVETVGVGQDEVEIANTAHTSIVVLVPGLGDDIQAIKAGIIEIADFLVINKADNGGADKMEQDIRLALEMGRRKDNGWYPEIFKTEGITGKGVPELIQGVYRHRRALEQGELLERKLKERAKNTLLGILKSEVTNHFLARMERRGELESIINDLVKRRKDPYSVVEKILADELKDP